MWWQWICDFYTANFKDIFGGLWSECVWQQAITCCSCHRMLQNAFFSMNSWSSGQLKNDAKTLFSTLHPLSPVIFGTTTVVAFLLLCNSRFNFHCYTQREATPTQKSAQKWCCGLSRLLVQKITKDIHSCKPASLNRPIVIESEEEEERLSARGYNHCFGLVKQSPWGIPYTRA